MSEVLVLRDGGQLADEAAELFVEAAAGASAARGRARVALTGGSSAAPFYAALRGARWKAKVPWTALDVFFTDERAVAPTDSLSNYGLAQRELLGYVPLTERQVHRMRGEATDLDAEAQRLSAELRALAGTPPRLDLVLLGLGPDGHICSLFAGTDAAVDRGGDELVRRVGAPTQVEPHVARLTLTPQMVVTARTVVLQVSGAAKAPVLARALKGPEDLRGCPAQWLQKAVGRVVVLADAAAAAGL